MKLINYTLTLAATVALGLAGCGKQETGTTPSTAEANKAAGSAATDALQKAGASAATEAGKAAEAAKATADQAAAAASSKAQGVIDQAKSLVAGNKYQEALTTLQQLKNVKLTPEQQKLVDDLTAQIQKALAAGSKTASDAAGAAGNLLKK